MHPVADLIRNRWHLEATTAAGLHPGASPATLAAFEARHGIVLPAAMRELYGLADGMVDDFEDGLSVHLDPLDAVRRLRDEWPDGPAWTEHWFPFASWMINSHCYIVRLTADPANPGPVALFGDGRRCPVAPNFADFLAIYSNEGAVAVDFVPHALFGSPPFLADGDP